MKPETKNILGIVALVAFAAWVLIFRFQWVVNLVVSLLGLGAILIAWPVVSGGIICFLTYRKFEKLGLMASVIYSFGPPLSAAIMAVGSDYKFITLTDMAISTLKWSLALWFLGGIFVFGMFCGMDVKAKQNAEPSVKDYDR